MQTKQVIVVRKDLNMRKGKIGAQCAHATMKVLLNQFLKTNSEHYPSTKELLFEYQIDSVWDVWLSGTYTKICVSVDSEAQLLEIFNKAKELNLPCAIVEDHGLTEFHGVHTKTCCAIGPAESSIIDIITGQLPLL